MLNPLSMLFGAALVALGVIASAYADRIRGLRVSRDATPSRARNAVDPIEAPRSPAVPKQSRAPKAPAATDGGDDVIAALVASGYKKAAASEATWACSAAERASVESWVSAALRRCACGGLS